MKVVLRILVSILTLFCFLSPAYGAGSGIPKEVLSAAEQGLTQFRDKVASQPTPYGFTSADEVKRVTLGEGFQVFYVDADKLANATSTADLLTLADPAQVWEFTLNLDGQPKSYLTIGQENGQYQVVHFGGDAAPLGTALGNFRKFAKEKAENAEPTLVKAGPVYYIVAKIGTQEYVIPAVHPERAGVTGGMDNTQLRAGADIVRHLKAVQKDGAYDPTAPVSMGGGGQKVPSRWFQQPVTRFRARVRSSTCLGLGNPAVPRQTEGAQLPSLWASGFLLWSPDAHFTVPSLS